MLCKIAAVYLLIGAVLYWRFRRLSKPFGSDWSKAALVLFIITWPLWYTIYTIFVILMAKAVIDNLRARKEQRP